MISSTAAAAKGMRIVRDAGEFAANLQSCQREAANAFGRDRVLLERYIEHPRHIEIQVFGDHGGAIHLNERECSAQRRYQKVLEESPSPFLARVGRAHGRGAVQAAHAIDYANAGTVEFIVAPSGEFFFMEINTGCRSASGDRGSHRADLVEWQAAHRRRRAAAGAAGRHRPARPRHRGAPARRPGCRLPPGSGTLQALRLPAPSRHVRIDSAWSKATPSPSSTTR